MFQGRWPVQRMYWLNDRGGRGYMSLLSCHSMPRLLAKAAPRFLGASVKLELNVVWASGRG